MYEIALNYTTVCLSGVWTVSEFKKYPFIQKSKFGVRPREISFVLEKQEEGPYWDRLLETKVKQPWLRVDFKNWKDEDDDEEEGGAQGQDLGRLQQTEVYSRIQIVYKTETFNFLTLYLFAIFLKYLYVS